MLHRERLPEGFEGSLLITLGIGFHAYRAVIPHGLQCLGDTCIVDLARSWFTPAGVISHLHLTNPWQAGLALADQVALADLGMVEVEVDAQLRAVHRADETKHGGGGA
jgi:hypothetical protein